MIRSLRIDDRQFGNWDDELAAPGADVTHLMDDLVLEVPRQDQDVVGLEIVESGHRMDRHMHAGREPAVLVRVAIDRELEEVGADPAIVQQRIALARSAVAADHLAGILGRDQERQQPTFGARHPLGERGVGRDLAKALAPLAGEQVRNAPGRRPRRAGMREIDPERAAVGRELVDIDHAQAMAGRRGARSRSARSRRNARGRSCRTGSPPSAARGAGTRA